MTVQEMCSGETQLIPGELRGYRSWNLELGSPRLGAVVSSFGLWDSNGVLQAECKSARTEWLATFIADDDEDCDCATCTRVRTPHRPPSHDCSCGIYGWYRPDETRLSTGSVFGAVAASGRLMLGDFGFRAERARAVAVTLPSHSPPRINSTDPYWIAKRSQVFRDYWEGRGVSVFETREALTEAFPPDDVEPLLGKPIPTTESLGDSMLAMYIMSQGVGTWQVASGTCITHRRRPLKNDRMAAAGREAAKAFKELTSWNDPQLRALELQKNRPTGPAERPAGKWGKRRKK